MKIYKSIFILAMLPLLVASCTQKNLDNSSSGKNLKIELVALQHITYASASQTKPESVITTLDIVSYNAKTGEVVFKNIQDAVSKIGDLRSKIDIYLSGQFLFSVTYANSILSNLYNEPVLYNALVTIDDTVKDKWYIRSGYPNGVILENALNIFPDDSYGEVRKQAYQKIAASWKTFTEELKKEGKYINQ